MIQLDEALANIEVMGCKLSRFSNQAREPKEIREAYELLQLSAKNQRQDSAKTAPNQRQISAKSAPRQRQDSASLIDQLKKLKEDKVILIENCIALGKVNNQLDRNLDGATALMLENGIHFERIPLTSGIKSASTVLANSITKMNGGKPFPGSNNG